MDFFDKVKELQKEDVIIHDIKDLQRKLHSISNDGPQMLQILADYDGTLTKYSVNGKATPHSLEVGADKVSVEDCPRRTNNNSESFNMCLQRQMGPNHPQAWKFIDVFQMTKGLSEAYSAGRCRLERKYGVAYSEAKTDEERHKVLLQWVDDHEAILIGERLTVEDIHQAVDSAQTPLREGVDLMFHLLNSHQVPVTVISAGIGEVVKYSMREFKPSIVSNFFTFDEGKILGFIKPTVSVYNKHEFNLSNNDRHNIVVLGDSLGDITMADSITDKKNVIKIGFLNEVGNNLKEYCKHFDVVLLNDQSMDAVNGLLKLILE